MKKTIAGALSALFITTAAGGDTALARDGVHTQLVTLPHLPQSVSDWTPGNVSSNLYAISSVAHRDGTYLLATSLGYLRQAAYADGSYCAPAFPGLMQIMLNAKELLLWNGALGVVADCAREHPEQYRPMAEQMIGRTISDYIDLHAKIESRDDVLLLTRPADLVSIFDTPQLQNIFYEKTAALLNDYDPLTWEAVFQGYRHLSYKANYGSPVDGILGQPLAFLADILETGEPDRRAEAVKLIGLIGQSTPAHAERAANLIIPALDDPDPQFGMEAFLSLKEIGDTQSRAADPIFTAFADYVRKGLPDDPGFIGKVAEGVFSTGMKSGRRAEMLDLLEPLAWQMSNDEALGYVAEAVEKEPALAGHALVIVKGFIDAETYLARSAQVLGKIAEYSPEYSEVAYDILGYLLASPGYKQASIQLSSLALRDEHDAEIALGLLLQAVNEGSLFSSDREALQHVMLMLSQWPEHKDEVLDIFRNGIAVAAEAGNQDVVDLLTHYFTTLNVPVPLLPAAKGPVPPAPSR